MWTIIKRIALITLLTIASSQAISAQSLRLGEARGLFMALATGLRVPVSDLSDKYNLGIGFDVTFSYTDNRVIPVFLYTKFGYTNFSGNSDLYKNTSYTHISSNVYSIQPGLRIYYYPIIENVVILMPVAEVGVSFAYFETLHQFKSDSNIDNFIEQQSKFGFHLGGGFSMFLIDVMAYYNYYSTNQFLSFELAIRIPIFAKI